MEERITSSLKGEGGGQGRAVAGGVCIRSDKEVGLWLRVCAIFSAAC